MFFVLSKVFGFVAQPSNFLALICAAGVLLYLIGRRRAGLRLGGTGLVLLLIAGYSPLGHVLLLTLTERFPAWQADGPAPDGIIILGGAIDPDLSRARDQLEVDASPSASLRCWNWRDAFRRRASCSRAAVRG